MRRPPRHGRGAATVCTPLKPGGLGVSVQDLIKIVRQQTARERTDHRLPSLVVAVGRAGQVLHVEAAGVADLVTRRPAQPSTQYRLGSITKTFTAAAVLLLAERGQLDLDASVEAYLPDTPLGRATVRQLLAHCGGVQREAPGPMWATMQGPDDAELLASLSKAEMVARPGERWHYSNLGYALLGQVAGRVTGTPCARLIDDGILRPLGLSHTTWRPSPTAATGYRLDPYQDLAHIEPMMDQGSVGVGGQLWSTAEDIVVWANALTGGVPDVLPGPVTRAMHTLQVTTDGEHWTRGWGLGLILEPTVHGIMSGHTGAMPGFLTALAMQQRTRTAVVAMANVTRGVDLAALAADLLEQALSVWPGDEDHDDGPAASATPAPDHVDRQQDGLAQRAGDLRHLGREVEAALVSEPGPELRRGAGGRPLGQQVEGEGAETEDVDPDPVHAAHRRPLGGGEAFGQPCVGVTRTGVGDLEQRRDAVDRSGCRLHSGHLAGALPVPDLHLQVAVVAADPDGTWSESAVHYPVAVGVLKGLTDLLHQVEGGRQGQRSRLLGQPQVEALPVVLVRVDQANAEVGLDQVAGLEHPGVAQPADHPELVRGDRSQSTHLRLSGPGGRDQESDPAPLALADPVVGPPVLPTVALGDGFLLDDPGARLSLAALDQPDALHQLRQELLVDALARVRRFEEPLRQAGQGLYGRTGRRCRTG